MDESQLRKILAEVLIPDLRWLVETGSTMDDAARWVAEGAPDGALVLADSQTAGRGRLQRAWVTRPGAALAFSLILRPNPAEQPLAAFFSPLAGLALTDALAEFGGQAQIKWPNDVLLNGRKTAGILVEAAWNGSALEAVVIGVGVNVTRDSVPPASELRFPATCVEEGLGRVVDRFQLLKRILFHLAARRQELGKAGFLADWEERLAFRGQQVVISDQGDEEKFGKLLGITTDGHLRILGADGVESIVIAGDVSLRLAAGSVLGGAGC